MPWPVLAAIGSIETDHGRSRAPGVRSGVNRYGCCAGPMQFNLRDGPPSTWDRYGVDGNRDGRRDVYDPADAIASAANYLRALLRNADGNLGRAVFGYNHSQAYVNDVLARARAYAGPTDGELAGDLSLVAGCADIDLPVGPANLRAAERVSSPRAFRMLPAWAMARGRAAQARRRTHPRRRRLDPAALPPARHRRARGRPPHARRRHRRRPRPRRRHHAGGLGRLRGPPRPRPRLVAGVRALRHAPRLPRSRRRSSSSATTATPATARPGPAPRGCAAHLHISWASPCYGTSGLSPPCEWVMSFVTPPMAPADRGRESLTPPPTGR